jgi:hypothetical protein
MGKVTLTPCLKRKLKKHKLALSQLADKCGKQTDKKRPRVQKGEFLLPLLTAVLPTLVTLVFLSRTESN